MILAVGDCRLFLNRGVILARNTEMNVARSHYLCLTWESTVKIRSNLGGGGEGSDRMLQALTNWKSN